MFFIEKNIGIYIKQEIYIDIDNFSFYQGIEIMKK